MKIDKFVTTNKITMECVSHHENPNMPDSDDMYHYKCVLKHGNRQLTTFFSMGRGLTGPPVVCDVLECLACDAAGYVNCIDFGDWCADHGYDTDSRKAEKIFNAIRIHSKKLRQFLGEESDSIEYFFSFS